MLVCEFEDGGKAKLRHVTVHALVIKDNKLLLVKRTEKIIEGGKWGLPSGYVNRNERVEEAVLRELKEETGWDGKVISFFRINSEPHRPNDAERQNIALEFLIEPISETGEPDWEQSEVKWFDLEEINLDEMAFDHGDTISLLIDYQKNQFKLPIIV